MNENSVRGLIGLCVKTGKAQFGESRCLGAIRGGKGAVLLLDRAASENTKKRYRHACVYYHVKMVMMPEDLIARASGRDVMAVCMLHSELTEKLMVLLQDEENAAEDLRDRESDNEDKIQTGMSGV
ncbi:MAG: hypothetical protein IJ083_00200 [Clostridia bacterium]|nr:hypothetical protein [Clostridia bacterium]